MPLIKQTRPTPVPEQLGSLFINWINQEINERIEWDRKVYLTLIPGHYNDLAGFMVTVEGSPIKASALYWFEYNQGRIDYGPINLNRRGLVVDGSTPNTVPHRRAIFLLDWFARVTIDTDLYNPKEPWSYAPPEPAEVQA